MRPVPPLEMIANESLEGPPRRWIATTGSIEVALGYGIREAGLEG
jgi:hypothetical protein